MAVDYSQQIAAGLAAAHEKGVVLINTDVDQKVFSPITLVQNWTEDLKR